MLRFLRKYSSGTGIKILYGVLAGLFVIWGSGRSARAGRRRRAGARRPDHPAPARARHRILQRRYEEMMRDRMPPDFLRGMNLPSRALDQLIDEALLRTKRSDSA